MLKKLFKYDMKAIGKTAFPILGISFLLMLASGVFFGVLTRINTEQYTIFTTILAISMPLLMIGTFAGFTVVAVNIYMRYYKNLMTDEGYLSFTLPVTGAQQLCSKVLSALIWLLVLCAVFFLGLILALFMGAYISSATTFTEMMNIIKPALTTMKTYWIALFNGTYNIAMTVLWLLSGCIGAISMLLQIYFAMTVSGMAKKSKLLIALVTIILTSVVVDIMVSVLTIPLGIEGFLSESVSATLSPLPVIIANSISMVVLFIITRNILDKKLNLN